ncbi:MAG: alanine--tRNA ligase-related protein [Anaerolineae bacterium]
MSHSDVQPEHLVAYRVIADHGRAITFMIGDGSGHRQRRRASVLRLILRRAARAMAGYGGFRPAGPHCR